MFIFYILFAFFKLIRSVDYIFYALVPLFILVLSLCCIIHYKVNVKLIIYFLLALLFGGGLYFTRTSEVGAYFPIFMLVNISLFYSYFRYYRVDDILLVSNLSFFIYLLASSVIYFNFSEFSRPILNEFFGERSLAGIEGSAANIDTFSSFIFLINLIYGKGVKRIVTCFISMLVVLAAGTSTPFMIFMIAFLTYCYLKAKGSFFTLVLFFSITMIGIFYISLNNEEANLLIQGLTNGRNTIWDQQISNLSFNNLFFGDVASSVVGIGWSSGETNNPHNAFLFIGLRFGFLFLILCLLYTALRGGAVDIRKQILIMAFLAACISNSNMFYIGNPFYLYMLFFSLSPNKPGVKFS